MFQKANLGSGFDILVDGKPRTYRDVRQTAIEAGIVFKRERSGGIAKCGAGCCRGHAALAGVVSFAEIA